MTSEPTRSGRARAPLAWLVAALVVALLAAGTWLLRPTGGGPSVPAGPPSRPAPETTDPALSPRPAGARPADGAPPAPAAPVLDLSALAGADPVAVRAAAVRWRRAARTDPAVLAALGAALLDPATPADLRARVAVVLGTLDAAEVDPWLLDAITRFASEPGFLPAALLALGAQRTPPEDDEVFDLGGRPRGAEGPGGLGITIRRRVEDPATREALARHARHEVADVRYAAARALAESVAFPDARSALAAALAAETEDRVAARLVEPLGAWAATAPLGPERDAVLAGLLDRALSPGADETRFLLEKDLGRSDLSSALLDRLLSGSDPSRPTEVRSFALTVLPGASLRSGSDAVRRVRDVLEDALARDAADGIRDLAARQLGGLPPTDGTVAALARAAREDRQWQVRFAAVTSLARHVSRPAALEALRAAANDPDPRVSAPARRSLR